MKSTRSFLNKQISLLKTRGQTVTWKALSENTILKKDPLKFPVENLAMIFNCADSVS